MSSTLTTKSNKQGTNFSGTSNLSSSVFFSVSLFLYFSLSAFSPSSFQWVLIWKLNLSLSHSRHSRATHTRSAQHTHVSHERLHMCVCVQVSSNLWLQPLCASWFSLLRSAFRFRYDASQEDAPVQPLFLFVFGDVVNGATGGVTALYLATKACSEYRELTEHSVAREPCPQNIRAIWVQLSLQLRSSALTFWSSLTSGAALARIHDAAA